MLKIKEIAKEKGYTITSLAEKIGMSQVSLSRIINGNPTAETLLKISHALDVDIRDLFNPTKEIDTETIFVLRDGSYVPIGELRRR